MTLSLKEAIAWVSTNERAIKFQFVKIKKKKEKHFKSKRKHYSARFQGDTADTLETK